MAGGGKLRIAAKNISLSGEHNGDFVTITVTDTGIPDDVLKKIFDPFFTTKPIGKGTGLGLSQVHGFASQAGGFVSVESKLGTGTSISITLPRSVEQVAASEESGALHGTGTVLLVEDNPDVATSSTVLLEELGYRVRCVGDAEAALCEVERNGIDLVLSDVVMPGRMDGLGLARHLQRDHPSLPIVLTSGYSEAAVKSGGEFPILRKPYALHELSRALETAKTMANDRR
jgi:CheY-like chemotaxis protein